MKVLFVTRGVPSEDDPMAGNYEFVQAKALSAKGIQVGLVAVRMKSAKYLFRRKKSSHKNIDGVDLYERIGIRISNRFIHVPSLDDILRKNTFCNLFRCYIEESGLPDIVHAHIIFCGFSALYLKEKYGLPLVITEHWTKINVANVPNRLKMMSIAYTRADQVICVSNALADSLKRNFHVDSIVINNMVSNLFFNRKKIGRNDGTFRFIACGAFRRNKRFDVLVDAFALCDFDESVKLVIVGDGEERRLIESKIRQHKLANQIELTGTRTPEEVSELLCQSDCFVLSSRLETFAIVVIEAMAKGLPVIATRSGGPETFLRPEHGLLVEKDNIMQLTRALKQMKKHYKEYNSDEIRQFCYDHFSQNVIADQIIGVYNKVLNN